MKNLLDARDPRFIGERLRIAREAAQYTQAQSARKIGMSRTTLVAIEQGLRSVHFDEIRRLARLYAISVNALLRRESVHLDMMPRFRKLDSAKNPAVVQAAQLLNTLASAEAELENVLGVSRPPVYPPKRPLLSAGDVVIQAEQDALALRQWLGLGPGPILNLEMMMEMNLGIRVYLRPLAGTLSGLFSYNEKIGGCILLNSNHPVERRRQTGAHELGHFVSSQETTEVFEMNGQRDTKKNSREERYANAFAWALLMPSRMLEQKFEEVTAGSSHLTRRHVIILAHVFHVSRETMVRRLENLRLARKGTWDWFQDNGGITNHHAWEVKEDDGLDGHNESPYVARVDLLAGEAFKQGLYSEGQLSQMLNESRSKIRELLHDVEQERDEERDLLKLSH